MSGGETTVGTAGAAPGGWRRLVGGRSAGELAYRYALVLVWLGMAGVFTGLRPHQFIAVTNFQTIFGSQSVLVFLALSLLVTLAVGEFDLSVASNLGLSATVIAVLNSLRGIPIVWCVIVALCTGVIVGLVNGLLVVRVGVDAIVATLGMGTLLTGISLWISNSVTIGNIDLTFQDSMNTHFLILPRSFWYAMVLAVGLWYVLRHTPLGRYVLFVGQARDVARLAGIRVDTLRWGAFVGTGVVSSMAGIVAAGTFGAFQASTAPTFLLPAFAAAFLGSTVVNPGRFNPWGSVIAIYFLITGITGLELMGLSGWIEQVFYGGALMIAVTVSTLVRKRVVG